MNHDTEDVNAIDLVTDKDARTWAMLCHLAGFSGFIVPFGNILGPLIVWAIKKDEHPFVDDQGKEALNFQLTMTVGFMITIMLIIVFIGLLLLPALCIYTIIMIIVASINANDGKYYRYPLNIRFFK